MSTVSGLSTEDHASNLFGTKGGGGLEAFFTPQSIAVIGATEKAGSIGRTIVWNLIKTHSAGPSSPSTRSGGACWGSKPIPASGICSTRST